MTASCGYECPNFEVKMHARHCESSRTPRAVGISDCASYWWILRRDPRYYQPVSGAPWFSYRRRPINPASRPRPRPPSRTSKYVQFSLRSPTGTALLERAGAMRLVRKSTCRCRFLCRTSLVSLACQASQDSHAPVPVCWRFIARAP